jgi:hypothetical protein
VVSHLFEGSDGLDIRPLCNGCKDAHSHSESVWSVQHSGGLVSSPNKALTASAYGYQQPARSHRVVAVCRETTPTYNESNGLQIIRNPLKNVLSRNMEQQKPKKERKFHSAEGQKEIE